MIHPLLELPVYGAVWHQGRYAAVDRIIYVS